MSSASQQLAAWATALRLEAVPARVRDAAVLHLLDGLGTALAAARSRLVNPAGAVALGLGGPQEATILGTASRVSAPAAALANGTLLHMLDYDDTHALGLVHATAAVLPAAFAVGEQVGARGAEMLRAAIAGYETVCRIAAASPYGFHARGIHATHASGVFSAALVAGLLAGDPAERVADALGIAGSAASGLLEFTNTGAATKQLHPGTAGMNGIIAARLAAAGATGPASVFEGSQGLYAALTARPVDTASITADLGARWETDAIGIKPYPACQLLHVALDAARPLLPDFADAAAIARATVWVHPDSAAVVAEPAAAKLAPRTPYQAKFSLQWSLAAFLTDGRVTAETYSPESIVRPAIAALASRILVRHSPETGPAADAAGRVEIELADGRTLAAAAACSRGSTANPMTKDEIVSKFLDNCGGLPVARELAATVLDIERAKLLSSVLEMSREIAEELTMSPSATGAAGQPCPDHRSATRPPARYDGTTAWLSGVPGAAVAAEDGAVTGGVGEQAAASYHVIADVLTCLGLGSTDAVHVVEHVSAAGLDSYAEAEQARRSAFGGAQPVVSTVVVDHLLRPGALIDVQVTARRSSPAGRDGIVALPTILPLDAAGEVVAAGDFRGQYRYCLERAAKLLAKLGLELSHVVRTIDFSTPATREVYSKAHRPRMELLGPVYPTSAGILMSELHRPEVMVALDVIAGRDAPELVNPGWRRYDRLSYSPGVRLGRTLFMSGFAAMDPVSEQSLFPGDLAAQTECTYASILELLTFAAGGPADMVETIEYVTPEAAADYPLAAGVRGRVLREPFPAAVSVGCGGLLRPEFLIEIVPTAVLSP